MWLKIGDITFEFEYTDMVVLAIPENPSRFRDSRKPH